MHYLFCSMAGSYLVDCRIISVTDDVYEIAYYDFILGEEVTTKATEDELVFPEVEY